jgi:hypothetical protein
MGRPTRKAKTKPCQPATDQSTANIRPICPAMAPKAMAKLMPMPA